MQVGELRQEVERLANTMGARSQDHSFPSSKA